MGECDLQRRGSALRLHDESDHDLPICPKDMALEGPNQLWAAGLTYVTILATFCLCYGDSYAWSRKAAGPIGRSPMQRLHL